MSLSRRNFLKVSAATTTALTLGPRHWGWAVEHSPFALQQDDPLISLPEGYTYEIVARTGMTLEGGRGPFARPAFPDLNVLFRQPGGKILLSTSHEMLAEAPLFGTAPPPQEEYDCSTGGAVTSLLLAPDLTVAGSAYNAGGMLTNCSGGKTPWGTVLTAEESTSTFEADHGFVWEVDPNKHTKTRLDACGRFEHETAIVHPRTGHIYLTEDSGTDSLLYRMRPKTRGKLADGGVLEAYRKNGTWTRIKDPLGRDGVTPSAQGVEQGALPFARLEGGRMKGGYFYFTETEDETACGKIWRLKIATGKLELWAQGEEGGDLCMPDNFVFDGAGNMLACEDRPSANNRLTLIDRASGRMSVFAELTTPGDEPTGPCFSPDRDILFLNLQRNAETGVTIAIKGPFPKRNPKMAALDGVPPPSAQPVESTSLRDLDLGTVPLAGAAALVSLRRRGRIEALADDRLEALAEQLGEPSAVREPKRRAPKA